MWAGVGVLVVVVVTWIARFSPGRVLTAYHDGLPIALSGAWVALGYALATHHWVLASTAGAIVAFHLAIVFPRRIARRRPAWVADAPEITIAVANVLVDNRTPEAMAASLHATGADLIVVNENNEDFRASFATMPDRRYRTAVEDGATPPDYAVAVAARADLAQTAEMIDLGALRVARVDVPCGGAGAVTVLGVHLAALTEPEGYRAWHLGVRVLGKYLAGLEPPFVVAGDFNATVFRPAMRRLMRMAKLHDAHDVVGQGLTRSLKFGARGWPASIPAFTRVDHALLSEGVAVIEVHNLPTAGSDHHPFVVTLAVRDDA
jgi:endonuclease/exonuclease/phosphatase (EEP) superfamily protein YafD